MSAKTPMVFVTWYFLMNEPHVGIFGLMNDWTLFLVDYWCVILNNELLWMYVNLKDWPLYARYFGLTMDYGQFNLNAHLQLMYALFVLKKCLFCMMNLLHCMPLNDEIRNVTWSV